MSGNPCLYKEAHLAFDDIYWNLTSRSYFVDVPEEEICQVKDDRFLVLNDVNYFDSEKYCQMLGFKMLPQSYFLLEDRIAITTMMYDFFVSTLYMKNSILL